MRPTDDVTAPRGLDEEGRRRAMTALPSATRPDTFGHPPARRLVAAAIVASIGAMVLSVAVGDFIVASRHNLPATVAADARSLVTGVPWIALLGLAHLGVAWGLASHRRIAHSAARVVAGTAAVAAAVALVATAGNGPTAAIATALLAGAYAAATFLGEREPAG
jgi:hypothetical protein